MITAKLAKIRWRKVQFFTVSPQEFNIGVITEFKKPVPESKIVDRNFYLKAVGASAKK